MPLLKLAAAQNHVLAQSTLDSSSTLLGMLLSERGQMPKSRLRATPCGGPPLIGKTRWPSTLWAFWPKTDAVCQKTSRRQRRIMRRLPPWATAGLKSRWRNYASAERIETLMSVELVFKNV